MDKSEQDGQIKLVKMKAQTRGDSEIQLFFACVLQHILTLAHVFAHGTASLSLCNPEVY